MAEPFLFPSLTQADTMDYTEYRDLMKRLVKDGQTTGEKQSEALAHYTRINDQRMKRLDKTLVLSHEMRYTLEQIPGPWLWLVITEAWCGDAAQNIPAMAKAVEHQPLIEMKLILRDRHPEIMDRYTDNGSRGIPKLICFRKTDAKELGMWGPRPAPAHKMVMDNKTAAEPKPYSELAEDLHKWYAGDQTATTQAELAAYVRQWIQIDQQGG